MSQGGWEPKLFLWMDCDLADLAHVSLHDKVRGESFKMFYNRVTSEGCAEIVTCLKSQGYTCSQVKYSTQTYSLLQANALEIAQT